MVSTREKQQGLTGGAGIATGITTIEAPRDMAGSVAVAAGTESLDTRRILLPEDRPVLSLDEYLERGGLEALILAKMMTPEWVIEQVSLSGLRGRGGAGFPTAAKWQGVHDDTGTPKYLVCNGAEGEPGTYKDRYLMLMNPYQILEGVLIAAYATGAVRAFVCTKQRFEAEVERLQSALDELNAAGVAGAETIELVLGPDSYLFGEEKGLLHVVEGGLPLPFRFPPYIHGLFDGAYGGPGVHHHPTSVNNAETLANVPHIIRNGPEWFQSFGTARSHGTMVFTLSGDIQKPGVYELPLGLTLRELIERIGGGLRPGRSVQAVFPGLANAPLTGRDLDVPLDFDAMKAAGSALGSGGFIVYDDTACMVQAAFNFSNFLAVESCNQCVSCKTGSARITADLELLLECSAEEKDVRDIHDTTSWVENANRCALPTSESIIMAAMTELFPESFRDHLRGTCGKRHNLPLPKITDYDGSKFTFDPHYAYKRPDWTYADEPRTLRRFPGALIPLTEL